MAVVIARHINGIVLNDYEFVLDSKGDHMQFPSKAHAVQFLKYNGYDDDDLEYIVFINPETGREVTV